MADYRTVVDNIDPVAGLAFWDISLRTFGAPALGPKYVNPSGQPDPFFPVWFFEDFPDASGPI